MDIPCICPECYEVVDINDMIDATGKLCDHDLVCSECFNNLEGDEGKNMSITKEQAEMFWSVSENISASKSDRLEVSLVSESDAIHAIKIADEMLNESQKEIDRLTEQLASQISNNTKETRSRVKELEEALQRIVNWSEVDIDYRVSYGSNGERDYYRTVASEVLNK